MHLLSLLDAEPLDFELIRFIFGPLPKPLVDAQDSDRKEHHDSRGYDVKPRSKLRLAWPESRDREQVEEASHTRKSKLHEKIQGALQNYTPQQEYERHPKESTGPVSFSKSSRRYTSRVFASVEDLCTL